MVQVARPVVQRVVCSLGHAVALEVVLQFCYLHVCRSVDVRILSCPALKHACPLVVAQVHEDTVVVCIMLAVRIYDIVECASEVGCSVSEWRQLLVKVALHSFLLVELLSCPRCSGCYGIDIVLRIREHGTHCEYYKYS